MTAPPGFLHFRWRPPQAIVGLEDVAMVFKVPGGVDMSVLPDLLEDVCRGPLVPHGVILIHLESDRSLLEAMNGAPVQAAMLRFDGRMPLMILGIDPATFSLKLSLLRGTPRAQTHHIQAALNDTVDDWVRAGLSSVFEPARIVVTAPAGYVFRKPSDKRSSYFVRAEQGLTTSGAASFVALAILRRLLQTHGQVPSALKVLFVDTMSVATTAFALRELLAHAGLSQLPQIDSFHSYGGLDQVREPLPGSSLCIISASSSMDLHREWVQSKRVYDRDVLTLVTFDDAIGREHALFALPTSARPEEPALSAKYDIRIAGENFFPMNEAPRKVLLTTTHHACGRTTKILHDLRGQKVFDIFRATDSSVSRRGLHVDGERFMASTRFQQWVDTTLPHWLKARTTQVVFQRDRASCILARHIAHILVQLGVPTPRIMPHTDASVDTIDPDGALVAVATVVSRGNALLSLSRELRNTHRGPRLYVIGVQVSESEASVATFDKNLKHSSSGACIDVLRMHTCLMSDAVTESLQKELTEIYSSPQPGTGTPAILAARAANLRKGTDRISGPILLPTGRNLDKSLSLNEGFAFWPKGYGAGAFQAEVLATVAAMLQNARTSDAIASGQRLRSPMLLQVALDPENFSRFNDGILQASILRAAVASELDYRGDADASNDMRIFLERIASRMGDEQHAELEFLTALAIGRLRLKDSDLVAVTKAFSNACKGRVTPLAAAIRFLLKYIGRIRRPERIAF